MWIEVIPPEFACNTLLESIMNAISTQDFVDLEVKFQTTALMIFTSQEKYIIDTFHHKLFLLLANSRKVQRFHFSLGNYQKISMLKSEETLKIVEFEY